MWGSKKRLFLVLAVGALLALPLSGCGGGGGSSDGLKTGGDTGTTEPGDDGVTEPGDGGSASATAELNIVGAYRTVPVGDPGGAVTATFYRWGVWGGVPREDMATCTAIGCPPAGDTIFLAYLDHDRTGGVTATVDGNRSGTSPQVGSAVWAGDVLGYERAEAALSDGTSVTAYTAVTGDAQLGANFEASTVDVDFTGFGDGRPDLSWDGLAMEAGAFGADDGSIAGSFYGAAHEGAAGTFERGGLAGVYGALRSRAVEPGDEDTSGLDEPSMPVEPGDPGTGATGGVTIAWGPRLAGSELSALTGGNDAFGPAAGLAAAARAAPAAAVNGVSQSSPAGWAMEAMRVQVERDDDGNLVYELTDDGRIAVRVPSALPRLGYSVALFSDLIPGIEPDLSSYPHDVLGMWEWGDAAGAFWGRSPGIPGTGPTGISPAGRAAYEGDAVGLHAAGGSAAKYLADVEMVADFDRRTVGGTVDGFRSLTGKTLGDLSVRLGETGFSLQGDAFSGATSGMAGSVDVAGSGTWGARWSDGEGWTMGGTFGFAADDGSTAVLGAFTACSCASAAGGDPDDPVSSGP